MIWHLCEYLTKFCLEWKKLVYFYDQDHFGVSNHIKNKVHSLWQL